MPAKYTISRNESWDAQRAEFVWKEWEYRHAFYWRTFNQWVVLVFAITSVPFIRGDLALLLGRGAVLFPAAGFLVTLLGALHLGIEHHRKDGVNAVLAAHRPTSWLVDNTGLSRAFGLPAGRVSIVAFVLTLSMLTISAAVVAPAWVRYQRSVLASPLPAPAPQVASVRIVSPVGLTSPYRPSMATAPHSRSDRRHLLAAPSTDSECFGRSPE